MAGGLIAKPKAQSAARMAAYCLGNRNDWISAEALAAAFSYRRRC